MDESGHTIAMGCPSRSNGGIVMVYAYEASTRSWSMVGNAFSGGSGDGMQCGYSVGMSGDGTIVSVGCPGGGLSIYRGQGKVLTYQETGGLWGTTIAVAAPPESVRSNANNGAVHVEYVNASAGTTTLLGTLSLPVSNGQWDMDCCAHISNMVAMSKSGTVFAISALQAPGDSLYAAGLVTIYSYSGGFWVQKGQSLKGSADNDALGFGMALNEDGSVFAVSAEEFYVGMGRVEIYRYSSSTSMWVRWGSSIVGPQMNSFFGVSLALNARGDILAIGASEYSSGEKSGLVRVFGMDRSTFTWNQIGSDLYGTYRGGWFGLRVALNSEGSILAVSEAEARGTAGGTSSGQAVSAGDRWTLPSTVAQLSSVASYSSSNLWVFRLSCSSSSGGGGAGAAEVDVYLNTPPYGGSLAVSPTTGVALSTLFAMEAPGWKDDTAEDYPLQFFFQFGTATRKTTVPGHVLEPFVEHVLLPMPSTSSAAVAVAVAQQTQVFVLDSFGASARASAGANVTLVHAANLTTAAAHRAAYWQAMAAVTVSSSDEGSRYVRQRRVAAVMATLFEVLTTLSTAVSAAPTSAQVLAQYRNFSAQVLTPAVAEATNGSASLTNSSAASVRSEARLASGLQATRLWLDAYATLQQQRSGVLLGLWTSLSGLSLPQVSNSSSASPTNTTAVAVAVRSAQRAVDSALSSMVQLLVAQATSLSSDPTATATGEVLAASEVSIGVTMAQRLVAQVAGASAARTHPRRAGLDRHCATTVLRAIERSQHNAHASSTERRGATRSPRSSVSWRVWVASALVAMLNGGGLYFILTKAVVRGYSWQVAYLNVCGWEVATDVLVLSVLEILCLDVWLPLCVQAHVTVALDTVARLSGQGDDAGEEEGVEGAPLWAQLWALRPAVAETSLSRTVLHAMASQRSPPPPSSPPSAAPRLSVGALQLLRWYAAMPSELAQKTVRFGGTLLVGWLVYVYYVAFVPHLSPTSQTVVLVSVFGLLPLGSYAALWVKRRLATPSTAAEAFGAVQERVRRWHRARYEWPPSSWSSSKAPVEPPAASRLSEEGSPAAAAAAAAATTATTATGGPWVAGLEHRPTTTRGTAHGLDEDSVGSSDGDGDGSFSFDELSISSRSAASRRSLSFQFSVSSSPSALSSRGSSRRPSRTSSAADDDAQDAAEWCVDVVPPSSSYSPPLSDDSLASFFGAEPSEPRSSMPLPRAGSPSSSSSSSSLDSESTASYDTLA
eukprot:gene10616-7556_t